MQKQVKDKTAIKPWRSSMISSMCWTNTSCGHTKYGICQKENVKKRSSEGRSKKGKAMPSKTEQQLATGDGAMHNSFTLDPTNATSMLWSTL
jgi:hypothetical protein